MFVGIESDRSLAGCGDKLVSETGVPLLLHPTTPIPISTTVVRINFSKIFIYEFFRGQLDGVDALVRFGINVIWCRVAYPTRLLFSQIRAPREGQRDFGE